MGPSIGLLGDVMLGRSVAEALAGRRAEELWSDEARGLAGSLDLVVANLECCLSDRGARTARVPSKPFFFRGPPSAVGALRAVGVGAVGLANNHALDYEDEALSDTLATLAAAGVASAGAGERVAEAREPAFVSAGDRRAGIVAVSDHPPEYAAAPDAPGIAFVELRRGVPDWLGERLEQLRRRCDLVIAFPHWGPNMTAEPAPWQRRVARELQEAGADLVAGHSAHVFHGVEWPDGGPILSDLGDALDDYRVDPELRNDLGVLAIWRPDEGELELVGLRLDFCFTDLARGRDADWIADRLERACGGLGTAVERVGEQRFRVARC